MLWAYFSQKTMAIIVPIRAILSLFSIVIGFEGLAIPTNPAAR